MSDVSSRLGGAASASVVMVVRGEPTARVARAVASIAAQEDVDDLVLVIAAPAAEHVRLSSLHETESIAEIRLVDNPSGSRSAGLNRAVDAAPHEHVVRVDARCAIPPHYVAACIRRLDADPVVGIVGGVQHAEPVEDGPVAAGIARALRNPWFLGNAAYRRPGEHGETDTVYLGAYRRMELRALGGYDETLSANEDFELAQRYRNLGFKVWLEEDLIVAYEPRDDFVSLARQYHEFGVAKVRFWRRTGGRPNRRQRLACAGAAIGVPLGLLALTRPRRAVGLITLGAGAVALLDHLADPTERDPGVRAVACAAGVLIAGSWCAGIVSGLARETRSSRDGEHPLERDARPFGRDVVDVDLVDDLAAPE